MSRQYSVPCPTCDRGAHGTWSCGSVPGWAEVTGSAQVEWLDGAATDVPAAKSAHFLRAELPPRVGDERVVRVRGSLLADGPGSFWALFEPALAALNGFDDHPELLNRCVMVACTALETLARDGGRAWLRVRVEEVIAAADAVRRFPPSSAGSLAHLLPGGRATLGQATSGGLRYFSWSAEGDIGSWAVCADGEDGLALVLYGEWTIHQDDVALGHRPLAASEIAAMAAVWPDAGSVRADATVTTGRGGAPPRPDGDGPDRSVRPASPPE